MHKFNLNSSIKVIEDIWQVGGSKLTGSSDAAIYLVRFNNQAALIDAGCGHGHKQLIENISDCLPDNIRISHLLLTHCHFDHTGGAEAVRKQFGCQIICHELDAVYLETGDNNVTAASWYGSVIQPFRIDIKIRQSSEEINFDNERIMAYHCPGHSPGSVVYVVEKEEKTILFGQDIHGPLHSMLHSDKSDYLDSLRFIMGLNADILCEGHLGVFYGKNEVRQFIGSYLV